MHFTFHTGFRDINPQPSRMAQPNDFLVARYKIALATGNVEEGKEVKNSFNVFNFAKKKKM